MSTVPAGRERSHQGGRDGRRSSTLGHVHQAAEDVIERSAEDLHVLGLGEERDAAEPVQLVDRCRRGEPDRRREPAGPIRAGRYPCGAEQIGERDRQLGEVGHRLLIERAVAT